MTEPVNILEHRSDTDRSTSVQTNVVQATSPLANDIWVYRFAIGILGGLAILALGGALVLSAIGRDAPQVTVALGSAAVGALAGLLTPAVTGR
jgi:hypothetical protein